MVDCPKPLSAFPGRQLFSFFSSLIVGILITAGVVFLALPQSVAATDHTLLALDEGLTGCSDPDPSAPENCHTDAIVSKQDCPYGGDPNGGSQTELGVCVPKDPAGFAQTYYRIGLGAIGGLSLLFIIFGGYQMLTSSGDPEKLNNGKTFIFYALFGLLLTIFGYVFIEVIAVDILHIPGFEH
jgi:hypothetical protein